MCYSHFHGGHFSDNHSSSKTDRKALLKEKEAILEAKLATVRHWLENLDHDQPKSSQK